MSSTRNGSCNACTTKNSSSIATTTTTVKIQNRVMRLESAVSAYGEQFNLGRALFYNSFTTNPVVSCQNGIMPTTKSPRNRLLILLVAAATAIATVVAL